MIDLLILELSNDGIKLLMNQPLAILQLSDPIIGLQSSLCNHL